MSLVLTPRAAERVRTVIGSSMVTGSPLLGDGLGDGVGSALFDLADVAVEDVSGVGGGVECVAAGDQIGIGEFLELLHGFATAAIDAAAAAGKTSAFLPGGFLLCIVIFIIGGLDAASGARAGRGDARGFGGSGRPARGALFGRFLFFDADDARALNLGRLQGSQLRGLHDGFAFRRRYRGGSARQGHGGPGRANVFARQRPAMSPGEAFAAARPPRRA